MNTTSLQRVREAWQQRAPRERMMVSVMLAMVAAFVLWYAVYVPLRTLRDTVHAQRVMSDAQWHAARADAATLRVMQGTGSTASRPANAQALRIAVAAAAETAGLGISRQREDDQGGWEIEADEVSSTQLFAWLDLLRTRHAMVPDSLSAVRSGRQLRVQASFRAPVGEVSP